MLTNFDIERVSKQLELPIVGVFSKDELLGINHEVGSYYINIQSAKDGNGTHWVLAKIYCDEDREENKVRAEGDKICEALYFDPFGIDMPKEVRAFLKPYAPPDTKYQYVRVRVVLSLLRLLFGKRDHKQAGGRRL